MVAYTANWGLYATYHLLGEPETTIDMMSIFGPQGAISYAWNIPLLAGRVGLSEEEMRQVPNFCCFLGCRGVFSCLPYVRSGRSTPIISI